jgi:NTE family protein
VPPVAAAPISPKDADFALKPDFGYWVSLSREFREHAIAAGHCETLAQTERLRSLHQP